LSSDERKLKLEEVANAFEEDIYKYNEKKNSIIISYLSSAAIRISTIYEALSLRPPNKKLYDGKLKITNINYYLRDNVCHTEPDELAQDYFKKRQRFIEQLSVEELFESVEQSMSACRCKLLSLTSEFQNLARFIKSCSIGFKGRC